MIYDGTGQKGRGLTIKSTVISVNSPSTALLNAGLLRLEITKLRPGVLEREKKKIPLNPF